MSVCHRLLSGFTAKRGTAIIEYALIVPALMLCVLGIVDTGRLFWTSATLQRAVSSAARCGGVASPGCTTVAQIKEKVVTEAWNVQLDVANVRVVNQSCGIRVTANHPFAFTVPGVSPITLHPSTCYAGAAAPLSGCDKD